MYEFLFQLSEYAPLDLLLFTDLSLTNLPCITIFS